MGHYTSWTNSMQREIQYIRRHRTDAKPDYLIIPADNKKPTYLCTPSIQKSRIIKYVYINRYTVGGGSAPFYIVNYYIKWVTTSWSDGRRVPYILSKTTKSVMLCDNFLMVKKSGILCIRYIIELQKEKNRNYTQFQQYNLILLLASLLF